MPDAPVDIGEESWTSRSARRVLLGLLGFGALGTGVELILLEHTEDVWQWSPVVLLGLACVLLPLLAARPVRGIVRTLQVVMVAIAVSGAIGIVLHMKGNAEFEREMYPSLSGLSLFWESLKGATPSLAPGAMTFLGLIGLVYTHRHPALAGSSASSSQGKGSSE